MIIGYARCSTDRQDLKIQIAELERQGADKVYTDHGLTGTNRERPGLREAQAAVREGDVLVVTKLDRLARNARDAQEIADDLSSRGVKLQLGATVHDPSDPFGKLFFAMLAIFAEFEADLIKGRVNEGVAAAKAKGLYKGRKPTISGKQDRHIRELRDGGKAVSEIASLLGLSRQVIYRSLERTEPDA
jgi:DNA invertase Pin-like site-specific DNA recombinase